MPFSLQKIVHQTAVIFATWVSIKSRKKLCTLFQKFIQTCMFLSIAIILPQLLIALDHGCLNIALKYMASLIATCECIYSNTSLSKGLPDSIPTEIAGIPSRRVELPANTNEPAGRRNTPVSSDVTIINYKYLHD